VSQLDEATLVGWCSEVCNVAGRVSALIGPFLASAEAGGSFVSSWSAVARAAQPLGGLLASVARAAARGEFCVSADDEASAAARQGALAAAVDACLGALNANNPALAALRPAGWSGPAETWTRRGEISTQGAALKLKLTKTSDKKFLTASRKKADTPPALPAVMATTEQKMLRTSSGSLSKFKPKRTSGEWDENEGEK
jgi:hypothetical protein